MKQAIKRVKNKTGDYTVILNELFRRQDVSARAKGLYAYIMTLPDDWKLYKSELPKHFKEGRDAINTAFSELEELGYIKKKPNRGKDGRVRGWQYTIYESIKTDQLNNRKTVSPYTVNPPLLNTDSKLSTKDIYTALLEKWNSLELIKHRTETVRHSWKKRHTDMVKLYGWETTIKAMENYATIVKGNSYYFTFKWSLWEFIARGLEKFVDEAEPFSNFAKDKKEQRNNDPYKGLNL